MQIQDFVGDDLEWSQSALFSSEYELTRGGELIGTLKFRSVFGSLATATVDFGCWTFKRMGFLKTRVTIKACGEERELDVEAERTHGGSSGREDLAGAVLADDARVVSGRYDASRRLRGRDRDAVLIVRREAR